MDQPLRRSVRLNLTIKQKDFMETGTTEIKKVTPNDAIISLIHFANTGKMGDFYKVVAINKDDPRAAEFEQELKEVAPPSAEVLALPLRLIL